MTTATRGADAAEDHSAGRYTLRVYIEPEMKDFGGMLIYKLRPYGEVFRSYAVERNGLIRLVGTPFGLIRAGDGYQRGAIHVARPSSRIWWAHPLGGSSSAGVSPAILRRRPLRV
jgi:hypothetical protein